MSEMFWEKDPNLFLENNSYLTNNEETSEHIPAVLLDLCTEYATVSQQIEHTIHKINSLNFYKSIKKIFSDEAYLYEISQHLKYHYFEENITSKQLLKVIKEECLIDYYWNLGNIPTEKESFFLVGLLKETIEEQRSELFGHNFSRFHSKDNSSEVFL